MDWPQNGGEFRLGDFQVQSGDARLVWKCPCPASLARRYPDAAFLKASVRRWSNKYTDEPRT
jgi:hypothetical protein